MAPRPEFPLAQHLSLRRNCRSVLPRNRPLEVSKDEIYEVAYEHEHYKIGPITISKGLAKFDDYTDYGVTEEKERVLIKAEIDRLVRDATNSDAFLLRNHCLPELTSYEGFRDVSNLADQLMTNFQIIRHDNSQLALRYCHSLAILARGQFFRSRKALYTRYGKAEVKENRPQTIGTPVQNREVYFALVDYLMTCLVRLLVRSASTYEKYWENHLIAIIARWTTKLKTLSYDPATYASKSLRSGVDFILTSVDELKAQSDSTLIIHNTVEECDIEQKEEKSEAEVNTFETDLDMTRKYYRECVILRHYLEMIVAQLLTSILVYGKKPPDRFETTVVIYRTALEGTLTAVYSDRYGGFTASSNPTQVKSVFTALELLHVNTMQIQREQKNNKVNQSISANVFWEWPANNNEYNANSNGKGHSFSLSVDRMENLLSILIPQSLANPGAGWAIEELMESVSAQLEDDDQVLQFKPPGEDVVAVSCITTKNFTLQSDHLRNRHHDPEICSLVRSPLRKNIAPGQSVSKMMTQSQETKKTNLPKPIDRAKQEDDYTKLTKCVVSEDSISVFRVAYVVAVVGACLVSVVAGMAIPFVVRDRIKGVDPFQITTFIWVLAGFVLIVCKSMKVTEWPWHDFLSRKVVCRSVKDLSYVTGIDCQTILAWLLQEERRNILVTRGPYNGMFSSRSKDGGGFSIDEPVMLSTLLHSGFIVLKVANEKGEHLVCLDIRKGADTGFCLRGEEKYLACLDVGKDDAQMEADNIETQQAKVKKQNSETARAGIGEKKGSRDNKLPSAWKRTRKQNDPVLFLREGDVHLNKIVGVYILDSKFG